MAIHSPPFPPSHLLVSRRAPVFDFVLNELYVFVDCSHDFLQVPVHSLYCAVVERVRGDGEVEVRLNAVATLVAAHVLIHVFVFPQSLKLHVQLKFLSLVFLYVSHDLRKIRLVLAAKFRLQALSETGALGKFRRRRAARLLVSPRSRIARLSFPFLLAFHKGAKRAVKVHVGLCPSLLDRKERLEKIKDGGR
eukprot:CAMPEP_0197478502 /NCGR_PEP_ID=MMETSP1309-20131121/27011_1 /TAXON_ID=464262 /ORGANISM="Genus nov. species nov., Strain RCC998" /LENGTH=192 /DNA_ID=CAMNT_0043019913 /DNA_START=93 /DNA_END=667 /DNA_ORIENTATION=-